MKLQGITVPIPHDPSGVRSPFMLYATTAAKGYYVVMLIVLGGLLGSGTRTLADQLAAKFGLHHYDIDSKKLKKNVLDREGNFRVRHPAKDRARVNVYKKVFQDFPLLSKMHSHVVVDDTFHREIPRDYFLSEAKRYYAPVIFVWIESDDVSAKIRLDRMQKSGKLRSVEGGLRRRESMREKMQPPPPSALRFRYVVSGKDEIAREQVENIWHLIQRQIDGMTLQRTV